MTTEKKEPDVTDVTSTRERKIFKFEPGWLVILAIMVAAIAITICLNINRTDDSVQKIDGTIDVDNGDLKINWGRYPTTDIELTDSVTTITKSGTYHLTGTLEDGMVVISANSEDEIRLILDNVTIKHNDSAAILCYKASDLVIELVGENTLEDGTYYTGYEEGMVATIYANADLTFQGDGTLNLVGNSLDGIVGKDDVKFNSGTYNIIAVDDGIRGTDSVHITGGNFTINSGADAIKSTKETEVGKGFVMIENGNFNLTSGAKGIKAINSILTYGGNFVINSKDDAVHSNNYVGVVGGKFNINSSDDGIHADKQLIVEGGEITVVKAYEGLEAQAITINDGNISLTTSDDGINAGGGNDSSANNRPGAGMFDADENCVLAINGGSVYVNASGDGVDSNGWLYFNGGSVVIDGPTNNGNGALDSGMGIVMNGGSVIAVGASGMAETLGSSSSVYNTSIYLSATQAAGTKIEIKDTSGNTVIEHASAKTFSHIAVGTTDFKLGEAYTIYLNGEKYDQFTISSVTTTVGNTNANQMMPPGNQGGNNAGSQRP